MNYLRSLFSMFYSAVTMQCFLRYAWHFRLVSESTLKKGEARNSQQLSAS
jgi:hypothetical protein